MEQKDYRLAAIMYTDIAGFSRMMENDEAGTLELLRYHNDLIKGIVASHHGTVIKTIGDAFLVDFKNTVEALQSALEIQDKLYAHNKENPGLPLLVRIGVHLGDIYFFESDALGEGINIAARLQSLARPGCVCFSQDVYNLVLNKIEFRAEKLGKVSLKNITKEIHAYEITTPNVEFDANRDKPRPGYKPGSYLGEEEDGVLPVGGIASSAAPYSSRAQAQAPRAPAAPEPPPAASAPAAAKPAAADADRSYTEEGSRSILAEIRRSILEDIKAEGRRLSVDEALERYAAYGVEAREVIATMADQGILTRVPKSRPTGPGGSSSLPSFIAGFGRDASGRFDSEALKTGIQSAVGGIVDEIQRSVERNMSTADRERYREKWDRQRDRWERRAERHAIKDEVRRQSDELETGRWDRELQDKDEWKSGPEELSRDFLSYRDRLAARCRKQRAGLAGNLLSFLAVNAGLWFLNITQGGGFLWAAIVSAAWGIGVVSSVVSAKRAGAKLREIEAMPELDPGQLADYKKLNRVKDSMVQHGASTLMVPVLLAVINILTGPSFLWFLIPTAAMIIGFISHVAAYSVTKPRLERKILDSLGIKGGWKNIFKQGRARREDAAGLGPYASLYREAEAAKDAIAAQLKSGTAATSGLADEDLGQTLDQYLGQVRLIAQSASDVDRLVEAIPMVDLRADKEALVAKETAASSESLKAEYRKSIEEIDKQERSYQELKEQSEVLRLRLGSSVNQLKQMRLDIARIQATPGADGSGGLESLKIRTAELSRYLDDLRSSYDESAKDPFAELERAERERLAAAEKMAKGELEGPKDGGA
jgi:class 3 adenylate cyclase